MDTEVEKIDKMQARVVKSLEDNSPHAELMRNAPSQYSRLKGADWFPLAYDRYIIILGQGGIGSWLTLFASRIGCQIHTYDMDMFEEHNMSGQLVTADQVGKYKVDAVREIIGMFSPNTALSTSRTEYLEGTPSSDIVLCGFDNMKARKAAFNSWLRLREHSSPEQHTKMLFMDGRLLAEHMQIFCICGNDTEKIALYEKEHLFDDSEVEEADCTFKQTTHCAAMIASQMIGFFTNWLVKSYTGDFRSVPFFFEYNIPLAMTTKQ